MRKLQVVKVWAQIICIDFPADLYYFFILLTADDDDYDDDEKGQAPFVVVGPLSRQLRLSSSGQFPN